MVVVVVEVGLGGLAFGTLVVVGRGPVVATVCTSGLVAVVGPLVVVSGRVDVVEPSPGFGFRLPACNSTGWRRVRGTTISPADATTTATAVATTRRRRPGRAGTSSPSPRAVSSPPRRLNTAPGYEPPPRPGSASGSVGAALSGTCPPAPGRVRPWRPGSGVRNV